MNLVIKYSMPFRASHAPSYKQTLVAILKFPITSFMPPLGQHLLLIEDQLHLVRAGVMLLGRAAGTLAHEPRADDIATRSRGFFGSNDQALLKACKPGSWTASCA